MKDPLASKYGEAATVAAMRHIIMTIFLLGVLGIVGELLLVGHTVDLWQKVPLLLILVSLVVLICHAGIRRAATLRVFQLTMVLYLLTGVVGLVLHYQGKKEFKLESNPELGGQELFWEVIKGAAVPPVLAPGAMILMGLLGLSYTYRHPHLITPESPELTNTGD
jgi:hypothetical protein